MDSKSEVRVTLVGNVAQIEAEFVSHKTEISVKTEIVMSKDKPMSVAQLQEVPIKIAIRDLQALLSESDTSSNQ